MDIFTLLDGRDGGRIGRRTANAEFLQFMHQRSFRIALRSRAETLCSQNLAACQRHAFLQRRQDVTLLLLNIVVIDRLTIDFQETIELHDLTHSNEVEGGSVRLDFCRRLLDSSISHLTGNGTLPDEFVQPTLLSSALNLRTIHIGRTDGLVSLLSAFRTGVILTHLGIFGTVQLLDFCLAGVDAQSRKVH